MYLDYLRKSNKEDPQTLKQIIQQNTLYLSESEIQEFRKKHQEIVNLSSQESAL